MVDCPLGIFFFEHRLNKARKFGFLQRVRYREVLPPPAEYGSTVTATLAVKVILHHPKKHQKSEPVGGSTGIIIPTLGGSDLLN